MGFLSSYKFSSPSSTSFKLRTSTDPLPLVSLLTDSSISLNAPGSIKHICKYELNRGLFFSGDYNFQVRDPVLLFNTGK